jgi:hypothetical protein
LYGSNGDRGDACVLINSDEQLHDLFELNIEKGMIEIVAQINDFDGPLQFSPTKRALHPSGRDIVVENQNTPSLDPHIDATELTQSTPQKRVCHPHPPKKDKKSKSKINIEDSIALDEEGYRCTFGLPGPSPKKPVLFEFRAVPGRSTTWHVIA